MIPHNHSLKTIIFLTIAIILAVVLLRIFTPAPAVSSSQLEYRIRRVETQISQLRGEISRLRNQAPIVNPVEVPSDQETPTEPVPRMLSGDPLFDRLATLVIEVKQDLIKLEERVSKLESPENPQN